MLSVHFMGPHKQKKQTVLNMFYIIFGCCWRNISNMRPYSILVLSLMIDSVLFRKLHCF